MHISAAGWCAAVVGCVLAVIPALAQQESRPALPAIALPEGPQLIDTAEARIRLVVVTRGLSHRGDWRSSLMVACSSRSEGDDSESFATGCSTPRPSPVFRRCTRSGWPG